MGTTGTTIRGLEPFYAVHPPGVMCPLARITFSAGVAVSAAIGDPFTPRRYRDLRKAHTGKGCGGFVDSLMVHGQSFKVTGLQVQQCCQQQRQQSDENGSDHAGTSAASRSGARVSTRHRTDSSRTADAVGVRVPASQCLSVNTGTPSSAAV